MWLVPDALRASGTIGWSRRPSGPRSAGRWAYTYKADKGKAMSLLCKIKLHRWQGCRCTLCGATRAIGHDWSKNCDVCARCGLLLPSSAHCWQGNKCLSCGMFVSNVLGAGMDQPGQRQTGRADTSSPENLTDVPQGSRREKSSDMVAPQCPLKVGDKVTLDTYLGRFDIKIDGQTHPVHFYPGHTGTVERVTNATTVVLSMDAQKWKAEYVQCEYDTISLPAFSTKFGVGVDKLKAGRKGTVWTGTSSYRSYQGVKHIRIEFIEGGYAVLSEDGDKSGFYRPLGNKLAWKQQGSAVWVGMYSDNNYSDLGYEFKGTIQDDLITGTQVLCGGDGRWDWVLRRE